MALLVAQFSRSRADESFQVFSDISELPSVLNTSGNDDHIILQPGDYSGLSLFINPDVHITALPGAILPPVTSIGGFTENIADLNRLTDFADHVASEANPHNVTPQQVGVDDPIWNANRLVDIAVDVTGIDSGDVLQYDGTIFSSVALTTDSVDEGITNLYFTEERARNSLSGEGLVQYDSNTGEISVDAAAASRWIDEDPPGTGIYFPNFIGVNDIEAPDRPITVGTDNPSLDAGIRMYDRFENNYLDISFDQDPFPRTARFEIAAKNSLIPGYTYIFDGQAIDEEFNNDLGVLRAKFFPRAIDGQLYTGTGSVALEVFGPDSPNDNTPIARLAATDDIDTYFEGRALSENKDFYKVRIGHSGFDISADENLIVWGSIFATDNVRLRDTLTIGDDEDSGTFEYTVSASDKAIEIDILDEISTQDSGDSNTDRTIDLFKNTEFDVVAEEDVGRMGLRIFDNTNSAVPQVNLNMVQDESGFGTGDPYGSWIFRSFDDPDRFITLGIGTDSPTGNTNVEIDGTFGVLGNFSQITDTWFFDHDLTDNQRPVFNAQFADYSQIAPAGFGNGLAIDGEAQALEIGADFVIQLRPRGTGFGTGPANGGGFVGLFGKQEIYTDADGTNFHLSLAHPIDAGEPSSFLSHSLQPSGNDLVYLINRFIESGADDILHMEVDMDLLPASDDTYDLGSPSRQWKSIYVGPGSYFLDGEQVLFVNAQNESTLTIDRLISNVVEPGDLDVTTDGVDEGTNNLYFTEARVHNSLSASGDINYDGSGGFSVTTYKSSDFDTDFSGKSTSDLSEGSNLYFTDARVLSAIESASEVIVGGDFTVQGSTTIINSTEVNIGDNIIRLNANHTGTPSMDAGIEIERGTSANAQLLWDESIDAWVAGITGDTEQIAVISDLGNFVSSGDNISTLTNDVGYITDYTVTQGDVTQHEAALTITESQISDLQNYLTSVPASFIEQGDNISLLTNDEGYITSAALPTDLSDLNNDVGFITNISAFDTDDLSEGINNLYFTNARVNSVLSGINITVSAGNQLTGGGTVSLASGGTITINHANTSSQSNVSTSAGNIIGSIDLDVRGHVTNITTRSLDGRYAQTANLNTSNWDTAYDRSVTGVNVSTSVARTVQVTINREDGTTVSNSSTFSQFGITDVNFTNQQLSTTSDVQFAEIQADTLILPSA